MSRQNILRAYQLHNDQSLATDFESDPVTVVTATRVAFSISASAVTDNTGSFAVEHRHYHDDRHVSSWSTLTLDAVPTLAGDAAVFLVDVSVPPGQVRLAFTAAGGTPDGTCDIWVTGAQEG